MVTPTKVTTALDAFRARGIEVDYAPGYDAEGQGEGCLMAEAARIAGQADVAVVLVGLPGSNESEGFDREHLRLPRQHDELVAAVCAANPRTVVALANGSPVLLPWRDAPAAILECYLGGQASGAALVDVLFGEREPGGRLAETFPVRQQDLAADPYFPGLPHQVQHREGVFVGYRHHVTAAVEPAFAFGHGLGYTTFDWHDIVVDRQVLTAGEDVTVTLTVTNTGSRAGADVVQVYLGDRTGVVLRPGRELSGFTKLRLAPGERRTVSITVPGSAFAFYDVTVLDWLVPSGDFELHIARSSADIVATLQIQVQAGVVEATEGIDVSPIAHTDVEFARRLGRPVPEPRPNRPITRDSTMGEIKGNLLGRSVRALAWKAMAIDDATRANPAAMRMMEQMLDELPLRAAALLSAGKLSWRTIDALVDLLNGQIHATVRIDLPRLAAAARGRWIRSPRPEGKGST